MYRHWVKVIVLFTFLSGCAERVMDIRDKDGELVGACNAGFDWHFYGLQDSIDYMLYQCAKDSIANGHTISDERLLTLDFTLPDPPTGMSWNKKLAMQYFHDDKMTERKLGYILAAIELDYMKTVWSAEDDLAIGKINKAAFDTIVSQGQMAW